MIDYVRQIETAILAHDAWKASLLAAIESGSSRFRPETVRADHLCEFGTWYQSVEQQFRSSLHYDRVGALHAQFHEAAARVLSLALAGHRAEALNALQFGSDYVRASVLLVDEMQLWRRELLEPRD